MSPRSRSTWRVSGQPRLHSETSAQNKYINKYINNKNKVTRPVRERRASGQSSSTLLGNGRNTLRLGTDLSDKVSKALPSESPVDVSKNTSVHLNTDLARHRVCFRMRAQASVGHSLYASIFTFVHPLNSYCTLAHGKDPSVSCGTHIPHHEERKPF